MNLKIILLFITLFNISVAKFVFAQDDIERVLNERSRSFASHRIAGDILSDINHPDMGGLRGEFINPSTSATEYIPTSWVNDTREYMERVNNRAAFDIANNPTDNIGVKKPDAAAYQVDMDQLDKKLKQKLAKLDVSLAKKRNEIIEWTAKEKERRTKFYKDASDVYEQRAKEVRSAPQKKLDEAFFKRKNLNQIENLSELTPDEAFYLRRHSKKPLDTSDPTEALEIINSERQKRKKFIQGIKEMSNKVTDDIMNQRPSSYNGPNKKEIDQKYKTASGQKLSEKYKTSLNARIGSNSGDIKALDVANKNSRLALLDIITGGSIDPMKNDSSKMKNKYLNNFSKVDIGTALKSLPEGDEKAVNALVRYTLEYGSKDQLKSLKIHATPILIKMNKMSDLNMRCR